MTREEQIHEMANAIGYATLGEQEAFEFGAYWSDANPVNPWKPATEMPANTLCYCRDEADGRPYLAQICGETGECFGEDMEVCFPKYFMLIAPIKKEKED